MSVVVRQSPRLEEAVHERTLDDGLRVHVIPKPGYQSSFAILLADYGSIDNVFWVPGEEAPREVPAGIAHFLEHKLFEDEAGDVFDQFARLGASANAYTYYGETAYHFSTSDAFERCLELLLEFVTTPYFTDEQIEKERKVIAQEIRLYEDAPDLKAHLNLLRCLYHRHPIREDITGSLESIARIDRELLQLCHRTFYRPDNLLLVACGDLDPARVFDLAARGAEARAARANLAVPLRRALPSEPLGVASPRACERMSVSSPRVLLGFKDRPAPFGPPRLRAARELGFALELVFGRSSAFFERHCASGLIDDTFSASYSTGRGDYAHAVLGGETPDPEGLVAACLEELVAARAHGLDANDFRRLRNSSYGRFLRGFNSVEQVACGEADATLQGWDLLAYPELLEAISLDDVEARLRALDLEAHAVSLVRPLED